MCLQLVLNNVSLTYYNPYEIINCTASNAKTLFALNGYPGIRAVAYNATAFQIPGTATLPIAASLAANTSAPCACDHCPALDNALSACGMTWPVSDLIYPDGHAADV